MTRQAREEYYARQKRSVRRIGDPLLDGRPRTRIHNPTEQEYLTEFWRRIQRGKPNECWPWTGCKTSWGYGKLQMRNSKKEIRAHRLSLELHLGRSIPAELFVLHRSDNPACCNPNHLFEGTHQDNMDDMARKGRHKPAPRGEKHFWAKLTPEQVLAIRSKFVPFKYGYRKLAKDFDLWPTHVRSIVLGKQWKNLPLVPQ